ncbi:MAG: type 4a pilus biogenesis protein PilO [Candidatus Vogelbacteria bacterium]|nr:type 4a pilus biogenesis protein PilO [Candidatus Vogelbacteria bacterium]
MTRFLLPLVIVAAAGVIFFHFTDPVLKQIKELEARKVVLLAGLANADKLDQVKDELLAARNSFSDTDLEKLHRMLPDNVDNVRLIIDLSNIARPHNMNVRNIRIKTEEGKQESDVIEGNEKMKKGSVVLSFTVSGPYLNFQSFMNDVAKSRRLLDVEGFSFSSNDKEAYDYNVEVRTYWLQ